MNQQIAASVSHFRSDGSHPCPSFPRTRESRAFRARTFEVTGFPRSRE
ncbi:hypothetical protein [Lysobacter gummosus]